MAYSNVVQKRVVYPRDLLIAWSDNSLYWSWSHQPYEASSETLNETAVLRVVCWLDVNGKFDTRELTPERKYEVVYVVKLNETAFGWERPVNLKLTLPNSSASPQERSVTLEEHIGKWWVDIPVGEFITSPENIGEISFSLYETESNLSKTGLVVKGVEIRLKN